jgi:hypothetical protein
MLILPESFTEYDITAPAPLATRQLSMPREQSLNVSTEWDMPVGKGRIQVLI